MTARYNALCQAVARNVDQETYEEIMKDAAQLENGALGFR